MILPLGGHVGNAFLVSRYQRVVLVWKWSIIHQAIAIGRVGSKAFATFTVFIVLQAIPYASHVQTNIEYSARHDG